MAKVLPRRIGVWSATAILVGTVIGSGIFRSPATVANLLPGIVPDLAVWVTGGLLVLCGALALAEVACAFPQTGGMYVFIREGWGELPAFVFGWAELVIIRAAQLGAVAVVFAEYFLRAVGNAPTTTTRDPSVHYIGAAAVAVVGWLNYRGVRWGTLVQNSMAVIKCGGLLALIALALIMGGHASSEPPGAPVSPVSSMASNPGGIIPLGLALVAVLWVYNGWAEVSFVAGEIKDAARNVPRVLVAGTLFVIALFVLANIAYFKVLSVDELRRSPLVAADVASRLVGRPGAVAIGFVVMFSTLGTLNGSMLTGPRVVWAMAHDGLLFKRLASVHPRYETPDMAILVATILGMIFAFLRTFEQLAATAITSVLPFYMLAVAAVFPLRRRPGYAPAFRTLGYPVTPALFIAASLFLLIAAFIDPAQRAPTAVVFVITLAGIPLYGILKRKGLLGGVKETG